MFNIGYTRNCNKCIKGFKRSKTLCELIKKLVLETIPNIPLEKRDNLKGNLDVFYKYKFEFNSVNYRIIYRFKPCCGDCKQSNDCKGLILYCFIGTREETKNIYRHPDRFL